MKAALCKYCSSEVYRARKWQEFCSDTCRWRYWSDTHPRTKTATKYDVIPCHYCGLPGDTIDHIPPLSLRMRLADLGLTGRYEFVEVHACHECNSALGAKGLYTPTSRKRYMKLWIKRRYARYARIPVWTDQEIAQLGYTLSTSVLSKMLAAEIIKARLAW